MCLRPSVVDLAAHDRPVLDALPRCRYLECVVLHGPDKIMDGASKRVHQERSRHDDQQEASEYQDGRGEALFPTNPACKRSVQRIERDGQDDRPGHQRQEGCKDDVAKHRQYSDQAGANQYIEKAGRRLAFRARSQAATAGSLALTGRLNLGDTSGRVDYCFFISRAESRASCFVSRLSCRHSARLLSSPSLHSAFPSRAS